MNIAKSFYLFDKNNVYILYRTFTYTAAYTLITTKYVE